ncbi:hypothetical protein AB0K15_47250 [Amycolatopsis sp. NPDC049253]|uniref:hypothetical protein n=1 Tax=Amycolatopsis sp. NPDC049253 TaxID=3155274 RepID=UPI00341615B2
MPLWLRGEHSSAFPAARPLPEEVELRLPFATVAVLSTPWRIEPNYENKHPMLDGHPPFTYATTCAQWGKSVTGATARAR